MNYYQEITMVEQYDIAAHHVRSELYQILHLALYRVNGNNANIGISFPNYKHGRKSNKSCVGDKIRVFAKTRLELEKLDAQGIFSNYVDYIHVSEVKEVGNKPTHYEVYTRARYKKIVKRAQQLQAHFIKKFGEQAYNDKFGSFEAVLEHCESTSKQEILPFISLISNSNNNKYTIAFERKIVEASAKGSFNGFGLSDGTATVPAW